MERELTVSAPPHLRAVESTPRIMWSVSVSLVPVLAAAAFFFGLPGVMVVSVSTLSAVASEGLFQRLTGRPVTIGDGSAALTGLLLGLTLPPLVPWWIPALGGVIAILLGKQVFGGLGWNVFNPALVGRAVLMLSWVRHLTKDWLSPAVAVDARTMATPLYAMKLVRQGEAAFEPAAAYSSYLWGNVSGCIGEVSALLLLAGGIFLLWRGIIEWRIPVTYVGTVALLSFLLGGDPLFYVLAGGLLLGALYMATDYVTSPMTRRGKVIFGAGCGVVTVFLRFYSGLPESVMFAILFMNMCSPLIDRFTRPKKFGWSPA